VSVENIKRFYDALAKDEALRNMFKEIAKKYEGQKPDDEQADSICEKELIPFAKSAGYDFTLEELKEYSRDAAKPATRQLSEEELAAVAGGTCVCVVSGYGNLGNGILCGCGIGGWGQGEGQLCACFLGGGGT